MDGLECNEGDEERKIWFFSVVFTFYMRAHHSLPNIL